MFGSDGLASPCVAEVGFLQSWKGFEMEAFIPLFLTGAFGASMLIYSVLQWYKQKELDEQRRLDIEILALESNLTLDEPFSYFWHVLRSARVNTKPDKEKYQNLLLGKHAHGKFYFFDYRYYSNSKKEWIRQSGLAVCSNRLRLPHFKLSKASSQFWLRGDRINPKTLPVWLTKKAQVNGDVIFHYQIRKLIEDNAEIFRPIVEQSAFSGLSLGKNSIVYLFKDEYDPSPAEYLSNRETIDLLFQLGKDEQVDAPHQDFDIEILKSTG